MDTGLLGVIRTGLRGERRVVSVGVGGRESDKLAMIKAEVERRCQARRLGAFNLRLVHQSYLTLLTFCHPAKEKALRRVELRMSGKYAFTKTLKELRFLHCQTSEHSNAVRYEGASYGMVQRQKDR